MKKQKLTPHAITGVFTFLLLGLFAVFSTVTVVMGAGAYRSISARAERDSSDRLASAYLRSMLRARDEAGSLRLAEEDGMQTLILRTVYGSDEYWTRIYVHEGELKELFCEADLPFEPENGETVCPAEELDAELEGDLLTVRVLTENGWQEVACAMRAASEGESA